MPDFGTGVFLRILQISKKTYFTEHLWATASGSHIEIIEKNISYNLSCLQIFTIFLLFSNFFTIAIWFVLQRKKKIEIRHLHKNQTKKMFSD